MTDAEAAQLTPSQQTAFASLSSGLQTYVAGLLDRLILLKSALFNSTRRVRFENGAEVTYNSNAELSSAIAALEAEIAELLGTSARRHLRVSMSNGLHS